MLNYLIESLTSIESRYANCGILVLGDLNHLRHDIKKLNQIFNLKQIIPFATRDSNTLDLIVTNLQEFYNTPVKRPNFGISDHATAEVQPKDRVQLPAARFAVQKRDLRPSRCLAIRSYLKEVDVSTLLDRADNCADKVSLFETIVKTGLDFILPMRSKTIHTNEPPWITAKLKDLIKKRRKALAQGDMEEFKQLRNRVNRQRKRCRSKFYEAKVQHPKSCRPSTWWREVKKLCGLSTASSTQNELLSSLQHPEGIANTANSEKELANIINASFLAPMSDFKPLPAD